MTFESVLIDVLGAGHVARFRATGNSMYPTIRSGDCLHLAQSSQLSAGDVVLVRAKRGLTAHRIVAITEDGFLIRGDNALTNDPVVLHEDVIGRVTAIERNGVLLPAAATRPPLVRRAFVLARMLRRWLSLRRWPARSAGGSCARKTSLLPR